MGAGDVGELRDIGELLANLKEPEPPKGVRDAGKLLQLAKALWSMRPATVGRAPCREVVLDAAAIDLGCFRSRPAGRRTPVR
jgi:4-hydroxy-3-polyprenylbenzoate decarboxylase